MGYVGHINPFFADINGDNLVNVLDVIALIRVVLMY
jgi:hypothetical protein